VSLAARVADVLLPELPDGHHRSLSRVERPTLVCIGHHDCETTRLLLPFIDRIHRQASPGRDVLAVLQDAPEDARAVVRELGLTLPVLLDPEPWALGSALGLTTVPLTLAVEPGGAIARSWPAFRRADVAEAAELFGAPAPFFLPTDQAPALRPG
jgi:hypothetical protein